MKRTCQAHDCSVRFEPAHRGHVFCSRRCSKHAEYHRQTGGLHTLDSIGFVGIDMQLEAGPMGTGAAADMRSEMEGAS